MIDNYRICVNCVMDSTDPAIQFDLDGICNHCSDYNEMVRKRLFCDEIGQRKLNALIDEIKIKGKNKRYDCILGISGGIDSTYVAYMVKKMGLRPLAVHLDNGWDSKLAMDNMKKLLKCLSIDLYTHTVVWEEFRDSQLSFLRAAVPDAEIPTDHAISAILYKIAAKESVQFIMGGGNVSTEAILPDAWGYTYRDWKYIKSLNKIFGKEKLKRFPHYDLLELLYYIFVKRIKHINILNYMTYVKKDVIELLEKELGWQYYGGKHFESIYTRFVQAYILPMKFNIDKRRSHLSTLICSRQMTREEALVELERNPYPSEEILMKDWEYVLKNLGLSEGDFEEIMSLPNKTFRDYSSNNWLTQIVSRHGSIVKKLRFP